MADAFTHDVFLIHSSLDKDVVLQLANRLKTDGLEVWLDAWEIKPGHHIPTTINSGLRHARILLECFSRHALDSHWTPYETWFGRFRSPTNEDRHWIPIRLDDSEVPEEIAQFKYVDYRPGPNREAEYAELLASCKVDKRASAPAVISARTKLPLPNDCVRSLHVTEDRYLQLLLSQFSIIPIGRDGFELLVAFDDDTPAIWDQEGKRHLRRVMPEGKRIEWQMALDEYLLGESRPHEPFEFKRDDFVFRYGSGGTLPIVSFTGDTLDGDYYCLFYRDVHPVGWNIANGGTDSRAELLDPQQTIERELREEMIIADFANETRYVFKGDEERPDHPSHMVARRLWAKFAPHKKLDDLEPKEITVDWTHGPDVLRVENGRTSPPPRKGFFLNINGEDFGIEVDRVGHLALPDTVVLFDGEIDGSHLVNAPIGLFEVKRFNQQLSTRASFVPDYFFHGAVRRQGELLDREMRDSVIPHLQEFRKDEEIGYLKRCIQQGEQYGLCPVTERIVRRFMRMGEH